MGKLANTPGPISDIFNGAAGELALKNLEFGIWKSEVGRKRILHRNKKAGC